MRRSRPLLVAALAGLIASTLAPALAAVGSHQAAAPSHPAAATPAVHRGLERLAATTPDRAARLLGIATFAGAMPTDGTQRALEALGLRVQRFQKLPLALVYGTKAQLEAAVARRVAADVYPNEKLQSFSKDSDKAMSADRPQSLGVTGRGVGVAIVDSGIDATQPALKDRVTHNVKFVGPEDLGLVGVNLSPDTPPGTLVVPVDQLPYNNSDTSSGHGTHVAGIVAANGKDSAHPELLGVAPQANLIGYGTGDTEFIFTILAAYDDVLVHRKAWNIRVTNNSWGSSYKLFDPADPINVATKAAHDAGVTVVFAAGNDTDEMQLNPYSAAPWVISVGASTIARERSDFSSGGLVYDNSTAAKLPKDRHLHFEGDQIGIYHPAVSAPGTDIVSTATPTGLLVQGPTGEATASGTSMATPHIAGLAALLLQARPSLTPDQVRQVLQVTAAPMKDKSPFWHSGYGFADAAAAVDFVRRPDFSQALLDKLQAAADARVQGDRDFTVRSSDFWAYKTLPATVGGLDFSTFNVNVTPATKAIHASASFPSTSLVGVNQFEYLLTLKDAAGKEVASSTVSSTSGASVLQADIDRIAGLKYGKWTLEVSGTLGASDPNILIGNDITVNVTQLARQARSAAAQVVGQVFEPRGPLGLFFRPAGDAGPLTSPEGCPMDSLGPEGGLATAKDAKACRAGTVGYAVNYGAGIPAEFTSAPLPAATVVGGPATLTLWLADSLQPVYSAAFGSRVTYALDAVDKQGNVVVPVAGGDMKGLAKVGPTATRGTYGFTVPPTAVPAGASLRLQLRFSGVYTSSMRLLYGAKYDSGLALTTGVLK